MRPPATKLIVAVLLCSVSGCGELHQDHRRLSEYGGVYVELDRPWLWFTRQINDDDLTALLPTIARLHPTVLQLSGQVGITDRSIEGINSLRDLREVLLDGSSITPAGRSRLRPGIVTTSRSGYH